MIARYDNPFRRPRLRWPPPDPGLGYRDVDDSWGDRVGLGWGFVIGLALVGTWTGRRLAAWDPGIFEILMGVVFTIVVGAVIAGIISWLFQKTLWSRGYARRYRAYCDEYEATGGHPGTQSWSPWYPAETRDEASRRLGIHPLDIYDPWAAHRPAGWRRGLARPEATRCDAHDPSGEPQA